MEAEERWSFAEALAFARELEEIGNVAWLEEPLPRHESQWCEFPIEPPWTPAVRDFLLTETLDQEDGVITAPDDPGLGIELDRSQLSVE